MSRYAKSLCVSNFNQSFPDEGLIAELQSTFQQFGDVHVKIAFYMGRKVAYLNFFEEQSANDAYDRFLTKNLPLFDPAVHIEPVRSKGSRQRDASSTMDKFGGTNVAGQNRGVPRRDNTDSKRYSHHLDRTPPEDDPCATRTLFIGNLDPAITRDDIITCFSQYGCVIDVDIKQRTNQNPVCFAFLRYKTVDEAYAAKLGMSGQMLLSHTCKIGYGKIVTSSAIWIGNIHHSVTPSDVEKEVNKFGNVLRFKCEVANSAGDRFAIVLYDNSDSASLANDKLRSFRFPLTNKRLRVDFVGPDEFDSYLPYVGEVIQSTINEENEKKQALLQSIKEVTDLPGLIQLLPRIWSGNFMVKSSIFAVDLQVFAGDGDIVASPLVSSSIQCLKMGQRVSINESHLEEMKKRCKLAHSSYCLLFASPCSDLNRIKKNPQLSAKPLKSLTSYLQTKEAMGLFILQTSTSTGSVVVCYALPISSFAQELLSKYCPNLNFDGENANSDDYLMMICFRSSPLHG